MSGVGVATALTFGDEHGLLSLASVGSYRIGTTRLKTDRYWHVRLLTASLVESVWEIYLDSSR